MTHPPRISRRAFSAGLSLSIPTLLAGQQTFAQTPGATPSLIAVTPRDLYDTLLTSPFERSYQGYQFEPAAWDDFEKSPYAPGIGGVTIRLAKNGGDQTPLLGAYAVYENNVAADAAAVLGVKSLEPQTTEVLTRKIEGYRGDIVVYQANGQEHSRALVPVHNVLVIGHDVIFRNHQGRTDNHADYPSIDHAAELIIHLQKILDRQTYSGSQNG